MAIATACEGEGSYGVDATTRIGYEMRPYADRDESDVLRLLQRSLGGGPVGQRTVDFFRWKHQRNPFGRSLAFVADADGTIVGFRSFMRWRWRAGSRRWEAVRAVDTATDPDHRGTGIFRSLTLAAVHNIRGDIDLIFNTPNDQSRPGYLKMGWTEVGTVPIAVRPIHPVRFLRGLPSARTVPVTEPVDCQLANAARAFGRPGEVAELLQQVDDGRGRLSTDRSEEYLRWRYAEAPGLDYRFVEVRRGERLVGLAFGRPRRRGRLSEFTLSEVLVAAGDRDAARQLLRELISSSGCDHVATVPGDPMLRSTYRRAGFFSLPGQGMALIANPLVVVEPDPTDLRSWSFALGDLEVF